MAITGYLAMTAAEFRNFSAKNQPIAWMACHFSPYGTALSNLPTVLPEGSLLILNDRTPICGHDPELIVCQLALLTEKFSCGGLLLDFQRPDEPETAALVQHLLKHLPCPTAVSISMPKSLTVRCSCPPFPSTHPWRNTLPPGQAGISGWMCPWMAVRWHSLNPAVAKRRFLRPSKAVTPTKPSAATTKSKSHPLPPSSASSAPNPT